MSGYFKLCAYNYVIRFSVTNVASRRTSEILQINKTVFLTHFILSIINTAKFAMQWNFFRGVVVRHFAVNIEHFIVVAVFVASGQGQNNPNVITKFVVIVWFNRQNFHFLLRLYHKTLLSSSGDEEFLT